MSDIIGDFTKDELIETLELQREKFLVTLAATELLVRRPELGAEHPDLARLGAEGPGGAMAREIEKSARRELLSTTHELLTEYCLTTGQTHVHAAQPWYQFARVLRNSVVHYRGGFVSRWPDKLRLRGVTEVRWRDVVLRDRLGEIVRVTNDDCLAFWREQRDFAERELR